MISANIRPNVLSNIRGNLGGGFPAAIRRLLDFDFTQGFPAGLTHSRASGATLVDENGNVVWANENLMGETQSLTYGWSFSSAVATAAADQPPAGAAAYDVDLISADNAGGTANLSLWRSLGVTPPTGTPLVLSFYGKAVLGGDNVIRVAGFAIDVRVELTTATITTDAGVDIPSTAEFEGDPDADGYRWVKITCRKIYAGSAQFYLGAASTLRDGRALYKFTGLQIQRGLVAGPKFPTTSSLYYGPRTTHDKDGNVLGYLHEPQGTNLAHEHAGITGNGNLASPDGSSATLNYGIAPNGQQATVRLVDATAAAAWGMTLGSNGSVDAIAAGALVTVSAYVRKKVSNDYQAQIQLKFNGGTNGWQRATLNYVTGELVNSGALSVTDVLIHSEDAGEFWRVGITGRSTGADTLAYMSLVPAHTDGAGNPDPTLTGELEYWGYQVEEGNAPTSLIPTYGAAATRQADAFGLIRTIPSGTWTMFLDSTPLSDAFGYQIHCPGPGSSPNFNFLRIQNQILRVAEGTDGTAIDVNFSTSSYNAIGVRHKYGLAVDSDGSYSWVVDGDVKNDRTASTMNGAPQLDELALSQGAGLTANIVPQVLRRVTFYDSALSTAKLQTLTEL